LTRRDQAAAEKAQETPFASFGHDRHVRRVEGALGMNVGRDRVEGTITIDQKD